MYKKISEELIDFIKNSPTAFHAIDNISKRLKENGYEELLEGRRWNIKAGGKYFVTRNNSSIIALNIGTKLDNYSFNVAASHSDSPTFKIKENAEIEINKETGDVKVISRKTVVEEVADPDYEISLEDAKEIRKRAKIGGVIDLEINAENFKRNAIQNAKQIVIQKVRECEKQNIFSACCCSFRSYYNRERVRRDDEMKKKGERIWRIPITILFPVGGYQQLNNHS